MTSESVFIDAFPFARQGSVREGIVPIARLARAAEDLPEQPEGEAGQVRWSVRGEVDATHQSFLHLHVTAAPVLLCQRCMQPFAYPIDSQVTMQLVKSESELDADTFDEDDPEVDGPDKVLGTIRFDIMEQVEDELVLCIPYVPKHDSCPGELPAALVASSEAPSEEDQSEPSPFAVLAQLKKQ